MEEPPLLHHAPLLLVAFVLAQATDFYGATGRGGVAAATLSLSLSASSFDVITSSAKEVAARQPSSLSTIFLITNLTEPNLT